jgi:acetyl esterase/lipase
MSRFYLSILFICFFTCNVSLAIQPPASIKIWNGIDKKELRQAKSKLIIFVPDSLKKNGSSIIICPGGSYAYLGMNVEGYTVAKWLNELGFTAFVLRYRVGWDGYHYPSGIQDLQRAIQIVRENSLRWNLNPNSVGIMGFSAGGHLAGMAATYFNQNFLQLLEIKPNVSLRPDFVVMNYPVVSMHDSIAHRRSKHYLMGRSIRDHALENKLSLEENLHSDMPPIFLMQAKNDETVDYRNSLYFYQNAKKKKLSVKYLLYNCSGHGFGINPRKNKIAAQWTNECADWFNSLGIKVSPLKVNSLCLTKNQNNLIDVSIH